MTAPLGSRKWKLEVRMPAEPFFTLDDTTYGRLDVDNQVAPTGEYDAGFIWVDITQWGEQIECVSGSETGDVLPDPTPGWLEVTLWDPDRKFDPANSASPYVGMRRPGLAVQLSVVTTTSIEFWEVVWAGYLTSVRWDRRSRRATVRATDIMGRMAAYRPFTLASPWLGGTATIPGRVSQIAALANVSVYLFNVPVGGETWTTLAQPVDFANRASLLDEIRSFVTADLGVFQVTTPDPPHGEQKLQYHEGMLRHPKSTYYHDLRPWWDEATAAWDTRDLFYDEVVRSDLGATVIPPISVGNRISEEYKIEADTPWAVSGRSYSADGLPLDVDYLDNHATWIQRRGNVPPLPTQILMRPYPSQRWPDGWADSAWSSLAGMQPSDVWRVYADDGSGEMWQVHAMRVHHLITPMRWEVICELVPSALEVLGQVFVLDDATYGLLDSANTLAAA